MRNVTIHSDEEHNVIEYYFNDGVRERTFKSERAAYTAALKQANATGKRVIVKYREGTSAARRGTVYKRNPDAGLYIDAHRHYRALGEPQAKAILIGLAKQIRDKPTSVRTNRNGITTYYTVDVMIGNRTISESFSSLQQAQSFAKSARKKYGFEAHVYS